MRNTPLKNLLSWISLACLLCSCDETKVTVYDVEKETNFPLNAEEAADSQSDEKGELVWIAPLEWKNLERAALSKNRYEAQNDSGNCIISVSALPGAAASLPQNVNVWAKEMGLSPLSANEVATFSRNRKFSNLNATEIQISNEGADKTTLAVAVPQGKRVWYFKMTGSAESVETERNRYYALLNSLQIVTTSALATESDAPLSTTQISIAPPEGWQEIDSNQHRLIAYKIERLGLHPAEFVISRFQTETNNVMSNINRWRRQLGLENWSRARFEQRTRTVTTESYKFNTFDLRAETAEEKSANRERMYIAVLTVNESIYYLKLRGDPLLLETQRRSFIDVLNSVLISSAQIVAGGQ